MLKVAASEKIWTDDSTFLTKSQERIDTLKKYHCIYWKVVQDDEFKVEHAQRFITSSLA